MRMPSPPNYLIACSIARSAWEESPTSAYTDSIRPGSPFVHGEWANRLRAFDSASGERPTTTTSTRCATNAVAIATPIPRDPLVTMATLPSSDGVSCMP